MKRIGLVLSVISFQAFAVSNNINPGSSLTTGPSSSHHSIFAGANNPAMAPLMVRDKERWRVNYFPGITVGAEIGDVDNFADDLDELIDIIDDPSLATDSADETLDRFNDVLRRMGESGYIKNSASINAPLLPLYYSVPSLGGTLFFDLSVSGQAAVRVLDAPLFLDVQGERRSFVTNTSLYLKSGLETKITLGYGREVYSGGKEGGSLYAGVNLNLLDIELSKQVTRLEDLNGEDVTDFLRDEYDNNVNSSTGVGIDIGFVWDTSWYRAGLTLSNINSPEFDFGAVGVNCIDRMVRTLERNSCEAARFFISQGRIRSQETFTLHSLARVDGLLKLSSRWFLSASLDLAEYDDVTAFENRWFNVATSYEAKSWWVPSPRLGYQKNLAGTELSSITAGFTFFKAFSLDFEWGQESVDVDGDTFPRRFGFALAFEEHF